MVVIRLSLLSLFLASTVPTSLGQTSRAVCLPYYQWTSNSQGKTPCEVAASLIAVCNGGTFDVLPLDEGQHYQGPTMVANANSCMCNSVTFSLMTACGLCQGRRTLRWSEWTTNCPNVTFNQFPEPLPEGLRVPAWAFYDVRETDVFDQFLARENANATESTAISIPSSTSPAEAVSSTPETESSSTPSATPTAESSEGDSEEAETSEEPEIDLGLANRIGGAVVGSLLGSALIFASAWFFLRRRRRATMVQAEKQDDETRQA